MKIHKIVMGRGEKTSLTKANDKSYSLRTTVPKGIVNQLDLKEGDSIYWVLKPVGSKFTVMIITEKQKNKKKKSK